MSSLQEVLQHSAALHSEVTLLADAVPDFNPGDLAALMLACKTAAEYLDEARKELNRRREALERELANRLVAQGVEGVMAVGHRFSLKPGDLFTAPKADTPEYRALRAELKDDPDGALLFQEKLSFSGLQEYCAARLAAGKSLPAHVRQYPRAGIAIRKA